MQLLLNSLPLDVQGLSQQRIPIIFQGITKSSPGQNDENVDLLSIPVRHCESFHSSMNSPNMPHMDPGQIQSSDDRLGNVDFRRAHQVP
jgi:hypothetical protein